MDIGKTALFGAAGAIGKTLANTLSERGEHYRVVGRDRARLEKTFGEATTGAKSPKAEITTWDPDDAASVRPDRVSVRYARISSVAAMKLAIPCSAAAPPERV